MPEKTFRFCHLRVTFEAKRQRDLSRRVFLPKDIWNIEKQEFKYPFSSFLPDFKVKIALFQDLADLETICAPFCILWNLLEKSRYF